MSNETPFLRGIHRLAVFLAGYVVLLITAGGLVKSLEAGLSVPDWPLSYGMLNPPRWWEIETVRAELERGSTVRDVVFACFSEDALDAYRAAGVTD